ncbi:uncharacterized protein LOC144500937 [Mustelus asterias]
MHFVSKFANSDRWQRAPQPEFTVWTAANLTESASSKQLKQQQHGKRSPDSGMFLCSIPPVGFYSINLISSVCSFRSLRVFPEAFVSMSVLLASSFCFPCRLMLRSLPF